MENVLRRWNCRNCGRSNKTVVAVDGNVKCEYCTDVMRIQPSRVRGGETPGQLSRPLRAPWAMSRRAERPEAESTVEDALGKTASRNRLPPDLGLVGDAKKRRALARLRVRYGEARELVSPAEPSANLEWILGARRSPRQDEVDLDNGMIDLVALWLQDLAVEVDSPLPAQLVGEVDESVLSAYQARQSLAQSLRAATEGFVVAFRRSP